MACKNSRNGLLRNGLVVSKLFHRAYLISLPSVVVFNTLVLFGLFFFSLFFALGWLFFFFFFLLFFFLRMTGTASPARKVTRWIDCRSDNSTSCSNCPDWWFACCYLRLDQHDDVCCKCSWCKWDWSKNGIRSSVCPIEHDATFRNPTEYYLKVSRRCVHTCTAVNHQNVTDTCTLKGTIYVSHNLRDQWKLK